jgi:hypothetical protein
MINLDLNFQIIKRYSILTIYLGFQYLIRKINFILSGCPFCFKYIIILRNIIETLILFVN